MAEKECSRCIHHPVCKTAESCDGYVSGCEHFNPGWISVKERLPEEDGVYITMTNAKGKTNGVIAQKYKTSYVRGQKLRRWYWIERLSPWEITHWMPLPQPPKGE